MELLEAFAIVLGAIISFFAGAIGAIRYVRETTGCYDLFVYAFGSVLVSLFITPFLLTFFLFIGDLDGGFDLATAMNVNMVASLFGYVIALRLAASRS